MQLTKLIINICAKSDDEAVRVLRRLLGDMIFTDNPSGVSEYLNDAGYTISDVRGNGTVNVIRIETPEQLEGRG